MWWQVPSVVGVMLTWRVCLNYQRGYCEDLAWLNLSIVANTMELEVEPTLESEIHKG